jgi:polar amino acid transport system permease protein
MQHPLEERSREVSGSERTEVAHSHEDDLTRRLSTDVSTAVRTPKIGQWVVSIIVLLLAAFVIRGLAINSAIQWGEVRSYLTFRSILLGVRLTLILTVVSMAIGIVGGALLAVCRLSSIRLLRSAAWLYVWIFRGTPLLVQILFWFNLAIFLPRITIGIPFGPSFGGWSTNSVVSALTASILALALNEAAYMCEIVRGGLLSVPPGQTEAAKSLGLSRRKTMTQIVFPQAMRFIVPPTGNQVIGMLKGSSLVSVIAVGELLYSAEVIYDQNGKLIPLLVVVSIWYIIATSVLYVIQYYVERHYGRGFKAMTLPKGRIATYLASRRTRPTQTPSYTTEDHV